MEGSPLTSRRDPPPNLAKREVSIDEATAVGHEAFSRFGNLEGFHVHILTGSGSSACKTVTEFLQATPE
jgi:hypothetical protein